MPSLVPTLLLVALAPWSLAKLPPPCTSELCEVSAEDNPCSGNGSPGRVCWQVTNEATGSCMCCKSCTESGRNDPCAGVRCAACPNGTVFSPTPKACCRCVPIRCATVLCNSCPDGYVLSPLAGNCCRCVQDCKLTLCLKCPEGQTNEPVPEDCCRCV